MVQTLERLGLMSDMISTSECQRRFGRKWFNDQVAAGLLVGVTHGNRIKYSLQSILSLQELQLQEAERQTSIV